MIVRGVAKNMMDVYMVAALAVLFVLLYAFAQWCGHMTDDTGGTEQ
ncbi:MULTISPECIES: hypothetical protein [unclassified Paenibacillus]|nr:MULTISPECIES: hypothetical protein [unclassified Paenibacillus]